MTKDNVKKIVSNLVSKIGIRVAESDLNQACAMFIYQPKQPKALKDYKRK